MHNVYEEAADRAAYDYWTRAETPVQKAVRLVAEKSAQPRMSKAHPGYIEYAGSVMTRDRFIGDYGYDPLVPGHEALMKKSGPSLEHARLISKASDGEDLSTMSIEELIKWLAIHDPSALVTIANYIRENYDNE